MKLGQSPSGLPPEGCLPAGGRDPGATTGVGPRALPAPSQPGPAHGPTPAPSSRHPKGDGVGAARSRGLVRTAGQSVGVAACPKSPSKSWAHCRHVQNPTGHTEDCGDQPPGWASCQGLSPETGLRSGLQGLCFCGSACSRRPLCTRVCFLTRGPESGGTSLATLACGARRSRGRARGLGTGGGAWGLRPWAGCGSPQHPRTSTQTAHSSGVGGHRQLSGATRPPGETVPGTPCRFQLPVWFQPPDRLLLWASHREGQDPLPRPPWPRGSRWGTGTGPGPADCGAGAGP